MFLVPRCEGVSVAAWWVPRLPHSGALSTQLGKYVARYKTPLLLLLTQGDTCGDVKSVKMWQVYLFESLSLGKWVIFVYFSFLFSFILTNTSSTSTVQNTGSGYVLEQNVMVYFSSILK